MNYKKYLGIRECLLKNDYEDYGNTDIYGYFKSPIKNDICGHVGDKVYRCHLVEDWINFYKLDNKYKDFIGISSGIRDSLSILSEFYKNKKYIIPSDVYPVYKEIIGKTNKDIGYYSTLETFVIDYFLDGDILLITDPLKPMGRDLVDEEYEKLKEWLRVDKNRLIIVDGAYVVDKIPQRMLDLYETNQVILLFSLSKSWLIPNHFGISIIPNNKDKDSIKEIFKKLEKNEKNLNLVYQALNIYTGFPLIIKDKIEIKTKEVEKKLNIKLKKDNSYSYLYYNENSWDFWLSKNILTIPSSVFGGNCGTIISVLN